MIDNPYDRPRGELVYRRASWTEEGAKLSDEEKNRILDDAEARARESARDVVVIPRHQMEQIHEALTKLVELGKMSAMEWNNYNSQVSSLKSEIFKLSEFPKIYARQCLDLNRPKGNKND